jgi:hypothetical protein
MVEVKIKKYNVCHNELFLKGRNGLYCLLPFEKLDTKKKATSQDLASRIENYHTFFPLGLYVVFFLAYPRLKRGQDRGEDFGKNQKINRNGNAVSLELHRGMEKSLITNLKETNAKMLLFPSRPSQKSEWFYTNFNDLQTAFRQVQVEYGGVLHEFSLDEINENYKTIMKTKKKYVGEIVFKV